MAAREGLTVSCGATVCLYVGLDVGQDVGLDACMSVNKRGAMEESNRLGRACT